MNATIILSQYLPAPRKVLLDRIHHLYGYTFTSIKFNTDMTTYDNFKIIEGNWFNLYSGENEYLPQ